jgi:hypothetical protein
MDQNNDLVRATTESGKPIYGSKKVGELGKHLHKKAVQTSESKKNKTFTFSKDDFPFLSEEEIKKLENLFNLQPETLMPAQIAIGVGISIRNAYEVLHTLCAKKTITLLYLFYHSCDPDTPTYITQFEFDIPEYCEFCDEEIEGTDELNQDIMAKIKH